MDPTDPTDPFYEFSQTHLQGKDAYQIRDMLSNFVSAQLVQSGVEPRLSNAVVNQVLRAADGILTNPASILGELEDKRSQARNEYQARSAFRSALENVGEFSPEDLAEAQRTYDWLMISIRKYAPYDVPLYQLDPDDGQKVSEIMRSLKNYVDRSDNVEIRQQESSDGNYEFSVLTEHGELPLGSFPLANPDEAQMVAERLSNVADELYGIKGKKDREAVSRRIRLMTSDPLGFVPASGTEDMGPEAVGVMTRAAKADLALQAGMAELNRLLETLRGIMGQARQVLPSVNLSSLFGILTEAVDDLSQSSMAFSQMAKGKGALDLSQFGYLQTGWRIVKVAQGATEYAAQIQEVVEEAIQVLSEIVQRVEFDTGYVFTEAKAGSWIRGAALPSALSPDAVTEDVEREEVAPQQMPPQEVAQPDISERLLRWETSLAIGTANRTIKQLQELLRDQSFMAQFLASEVGPAEVPAELPNRLDAFEPEGFSPL